MRATMAIPRCGTYVNLASQQTQRQTDCQAALLAASENLQLDARTVAKLRQDFGEPLADQILTSARLQSKARAKLGEGTWWVSERSLQQATAWQVARVKASWFGHDPVDDLCCGIGGDAIQLAKRGSVLAVDSDPTLIPMVAANLDQSHSSYPTGVLCGDVLSLPRTSGAAVHIDPDRRPSQRRSSAPELSQPAWQNVEKLVNQTHAAIVKLAPAAEPTAETIDHWHRCWISLAGSVREQSLICGQAVDRSGQCHGGRSALVIKADGRHRWFTAETQTSDGQRCGDVADRPLAWMIDPDAAIRAAGLTEAYANQHGLKVLGKASGFLTAEDPPPLDDSATATAVVGRVIWSGSCDDRKLRRELRARNVHPAVIKCRGTEHDPATLCKRYRSCGAQPVTLWIGRAAGRVVVAMTD